MKALILAGGRGSRLEDWTKERNKSMIKLYEKPLIENNLDHAVDIGVSEIILVCCYKPEEIRKYIGNEYKGVKVRYIIEKEGRGLVSAIENAKEELGKSDFILMLADEILIEANLREMIRKFKKEELFAVCGIIYEEDKLSIAKTYTAMVNEKNRAFRLIEKPKVKINNIKGTGHCVLKNEILNYIERTPINAIRGQKELVDLIQVAIDDGKKVCVYPVTKEYVNVNTKEDFELAKEIVKKSNPKVLVVHTQMKYYGGAELLIVELCNWLTKRGIKNDILALSKSKEVEDALINTDIIIPKHNIDLQPPGFKSIRDILNFIRVYRKELKKLMESYDVINFHDFPVTWTLWPRKKASVWFMNLPPNLWSRPEANFLLKILNKLRIKLDRFVVRNSMDIIAVAESLNKIRAKERYGRDAKMVYFGVNYDFFSKGNKKRVVKKFNLEKRFVVIQSGMLTGVKNQIVSIKTIEKLKDKIPNILLVLTGRDDPEYRKKLDSYVKEKGLEKWVLFAGNLPTREELTNLYKASDIGLFPIGEMGGVLAPFEVLCAGTPVVVSEDIETAAMIKKNNFGIVTKEYDKAILEIYNNKEKYKQEAKKAFEFIKKNLSWEMFAERMIKAYKETWKRHR
jgi:glucose-1-phosphate thymidylyltransferase/bifunctional UDP-N-acetylglucosamine pyrophosphorylase/glucosamine-1-phosphate N-acetyltransferase